MNRNAIVGFLLGAAIAAAIAVIVRWDRPSSQPSAHEQHSSQTPPSVHNHHGNSAKKSDLDTHPFVRDMDRDMAKMMSDMHAPGYSGRWDADFLAMMIPHHQGAIDMAKLVLVHGNDPLTRELAVEIIASQQAEIEAMTARLAILRLKPEDRASQEFPSLSGTRGVKE